MKATGIIVEYNPFHNGHKLHAHASKEKTNADVVIAIMSGHFLQRGEPAFVDKWTRAKMALQNGVDLVFELPYAFSTAHAPLFAQGAIQLLDAALCHAYCFGSEDGHIEPFHNSMAVIETHHTTYEAIIQQHVTKGMSYPSALNHAYDTLITQYKEAGPFVNLSKPNNILGFHYMEAAAAMNSKMKAETIKRVGANYHDEQFTNERIGSATAIRKSFLQTGELTAVQKYIPDETHLLLKKQLSHSGSFGDWNHFYPYLRMTILQNKPERLREIADVTEGIENLIYRAAVTSENFSTFMAAVKSKRYTWTRIQRMLTHILTGYTYEERERIKTPSYLRLLGMTENGRNYLNVQKQNFTLPIVTKTAAFKDPSLTVDIRTSNLYAIGLNAPSLINMDYKQPPIYIR